jgi:C-terminal processing protease CtpA/Prc
MKKNISIILLCCAAQAFGQSAYQKDFNYYWQTIKDNFAYFDRQKTNWDEVKTIYSWKTDTIKTKDGFIHFLEKVNNELHNGHVYLNTNRNNSNRLIPSGSDMKINYKDNKFVITELRENFNAEACGLKRGMIVVRYNDMPMDMAIQDFLPMTIHKFDVDSYEYAANMALAGKHHIKRKITVLENGVEKDYFPDAKPNKTEENFKELLEQKKLPGNIGYIRINNSLGNNDLIKAFDKAVDGMMDTDGFILDLRETAGGGNTTVARAIMGRFIELERAYQKHIYTSEETETGIRRSTLELVSPRKNSYKKPLVILVGNWTASMGEGIAIGFDGMRRGKIIGTKMAGLLGENFTFETPELKIPFSFPAAQLQRVNGQPREDFMPNPVVEDPSTIFKVAADQLKVQAK